ncbi:hypothetical protein GOV08_02390 [Candidatus Woesearchaeota archaeon]|nr:hypothetical protein [Candidatus Woesearchaeota archaeon]
MGRGINKNRFVNDESLITVIYNKIKNRTDTDENRKAFKKDPSSIVDNTMSPSLIDKLQENIIISFKNDENAMLMIKEDFFKNYYNIAVEQFPFLVNRTMNRLYNDLCIHSGDYTLFIPRLFSSGDITLTRGINSSIEYFSNSIDDKIVRANVIKSDGKKDVERYSLRTIRASIRFANLVGKNKIKMLEALSELNPEDIKDEPIIFH